MEVYAYYEGGSGYNNTVAVNTFIAALAGAFGGSSGAAGEAGNIFSGIDDAVTAGAGGVGGSGNDLVPAAYLSYILFDQNYEAIQNGYHEISSSADMAQERLFLDDIAINEPGYLYIYTSMQSDTSLPVYFDDLKVTHTHSTVVQKDDYLPFGLSFNSYSRAAITAQNFKFNGGSEVEAMTDWYSTPFRKYDPALGRFHGVDALAELYTGITPSHFGMNNPVNYNDPTGLTSAPKMSDTERGEKHSGGLEGLGSGLGPDNMAYYGRGGPLLGWNAVNPGPDLREAAWALSSASNLSSYGTRYHNRKFARQLISGNNNQNSGAGQKTNKNQFQKGVDAIKKDIKVYNDQIGNIPEAKISEMPILMTEEEMDAAMAEYKYGGKMGGLGPIANIDGVASTGSIVEILVNRITQTDLSTTSTFTISTNLEGIPDITGYFMEPAGESTTESGQDRRIPPGTYNVDPYTRPDGREAFIVYNESVSRSRAILIHSGNTPQHTLGCLMGGSSYSENRILNSSRTTRYIYNYLKYFGAGGIQMIISDGF